jgi:hypothetical protein
MHHIDRVTKPTEVRDDLGEATDVACGHEIPVDRDQSSGFPL